MTLKEAKAVLNREFPDKSHCICVSLWTFDHSPGKNNDPEFKVSLLPGFKGEECVQFVGVTMAEAMEQALAARPTGEPTAVDEIDAQVAELAAA